MIAEIGSALLTRVLLCLAFVLQPHHATCPDRWYAEGIRPNGAFTCRPVLGDPTQDLEDAHNRINIADPRAVTSQIYCTGGAHPIVVGPRTVGCQRSQ